MKKVLDNKSRNDVDIYPMLSDACVKGDVTTVKLITALTDLNTDGNAVDDQLLLTIFAEWAGRDEVKESALPIVRALIAAGADVNAINRDNMTPLMMACRYGAPSSVVQALLDAGADVNAQSKGGWTPWLYAFCRQDMDTMDLLVTDGAETAIHVNAGDDYDGYMTPLIIACCHGSAVAVKLLIAAGADVNEEDEHGGTALSYACSRKSANPAVVKALIAAGAKVNDQMLLDVLCNKGDLDIVQELLAAGAALNAEALAAELQRRSKIFS